ncbi:hypothetical protein CVT26_005273 [Gymnopilus dilepis]|uniref:Carbohydrate-binding module family 19 domain-containing protein n=1 Tax=Gymnopilus dilepis TaxID=231916 RepID=A0A409WHF0_9AGAR|nr:hypothetical protein CVT26_005273 [Gymnopilus dilepis]
MHFAISVIISVLASTLVLSAPALDAATLLQNGQAAQKFNAQFQNIKAGDSCQSGEAACIGNAIAKCNNGQFDTSQGLCQKTESCFALPNVRAQGTVLRCTSVNSALSLINATGATGGLTGDETEDSGNSNEGGNTTTTMSSGSSKGKADQNPNNERTSAAAATATQTEAPDIVTVTVTLTATPAPITVEATTQTLSPDQASSLLLSILGDAIPTPASPASSVAAASAPIAVSSATPSAAIAVSSAASSAAVALPAVQVTTVPLLSSTFAATGPTAAVSAPPASSPAAAAAVVSTSPSTDSSAYGPGSYGGY